MSYGLRVQVKLSGDTGMHDRVAAAFSPASIDKILHYANRPTTEVIAAGGDV